MTDLQKALIKALREGNLFDFLSNEGHRLDKSDLLTLAKEMDYAIYSEEEWVKTRIATHAIAELEERWA